MKTELDFSDLCESAEPRPSKDGLQAGGVMYLGMCFLNSVEASIGELAYLEPALAIDVTFHEDDDTPEIQVIEPPAVSEMRNDIARLYAAHRSLARSMGTSPKLATYAHYVELCKREKMTPLKLR